MASTAEKEAEETIAVTVQIISFCQESENEELRNSQKLFDFSFPTAQSGGLSTKALLQTLSSPKNHLSAYQALMKMRSILQLKNPNLTPQILSSRKLDIQTIPLFFSESNHGTKRAVIIGISYIHYNHEIKSSHEISLQFMNYLIQKEQYLPSNITILLDDGIQLNPTRENILNAFRNLVTMSITGDTCVVYYCGHFGRIQEEEEADNIEEDELLTTLVPCDYDKKGHISKHDLVQLLICPMVRGVTLTCVFDFCLNYGNMSNDSMAVLELPFRFRANEKEQGLKFVDGFDFGDILDYREKDHTLLDISHHQSDCCAIL